MSEKKDFFNKYFRLILFAAVVVMILYFIVRNVSAFGNVLLVLLGFGAVILVHEFGHFIVAKLSDIKVEAFSIFMPPTLLGVQRKEEGIRIRILPDIFPKKGNDSGEGDESNEGALRITIKGEGKASETEYRMGLIPFGGFVKLLGQEDTSAVKSSDDPRSFANKTTGIRAAVLAAGVVCNIISAVIIFMIVFLIGINLTPAVVGGVTPDSPAARAGLRAGDEVISVAGKSDDLDFSNIGIAAALSGEDEKIPMRVRHEDGTEEDLELVAELQPGGQMRAFGIEIPVSLTVGRLSEEGAADLFSKTGFLAGDKIKSVEGREVQSFWELREVIQDSLLPEVALSVERVGDSGETEVLASKIGLDLTFASSHNVESESELYHIYSMVPRLRIGIVSDKLTSGADDSESSLQSGDIILAIGDVENPTYSEMRSITEASKDKELPIQILRSSADGTEKTLTVMVTPKKPAGSERVLIGIGVVLDAEHPVVAKTIDTEGGQARLDIPRGAAITAVDGAPVSNFYEIIKEIRRYGGERITINWRVDEEIAGSVALNVDNNGEGITVKSTFSEIIPFDDLKRTYKAGGPIDAIVMGYRRTVMFVAQTYVTLRRLIGGLVSPKNLMGPVGIITLSYRIVAEQPLIYYVYFLGLISAVIAVFNFLPLPPLDGGLVVLLLVEKIKGSALSERVQGIIAYAGWALILTLILYVTFNDIVRSFFS
ncbi:MAG: site-2 protease family protein [Planctomycetes bacterium]|nr:site-2 protease family protein [Planctomycetota bacterium]MBL7143178.1 site-2 protease family protein [Phycisphaerae bacterium]